MAVESFVRLPDGSSPLLTQTTIATESAGDEPGREIIIEWPISSVVTHPFCTHTYTVCVCCGWTERLGSAMKASNIDVKVRLWFKEN